ncbi:MAG: hypothetical protein JST94_11905 [Bacteroidetes bacterium]|nr:hypothetical protein [Bacteroidota bacterium]MBS1672130.1 hypothetical protein [Bacteroidota bacterium]
MSTVYRKDFNERSFYMVVDNSRMVAVTKGFRGMSCTITFSINRLTIEDAFNPEYSCESTGEEFTKNYKEVQQEILSLMIKK